MSSPYGIIVMCAKVLYSRKEQPWSSSPESCRFPSTNPESVLDICFNFGIQLEHACGGSCACTTCHVIVKEGDGNLSEMDDDEADRLDMAPGLTLHSRRLSGDRQRRCCGRISSWNKNFVSEGGPLKVVNTKLKDIGRDWSGSCHRTSLGAPTDRPRNRFRSFFRNQPSDANSNVLDSGLNAALAAFTSRNGRNPGAGPMKQATPRLSVGSRPPVLQRFRYTPYYRYAHQVRWIPSNRARNCRSRVQKCDRAASSPTILTPR